MLSECPWLANCKFCKNPYFSTANLYNCFFMSVHIFGTPNAVITFLSSVNKDLITFHIHSISSLILLYSKNALTPISSLRKGFSLSSLTTRSDINVCWLPVSSKLFTTQNWSSVIFIINPLAVCNKIAVSFLAKQVAVSSVLFDVLWWLFFPSMVFGVLFFEKHNAVWWLHSARQRKHLTFALQFFLMRPGFKQLQQHFPLFNISLLEFMSVTI